MPETAPEIPASVFLNRLNKVRQHMNQSNLDFCIVYGDREHTANLTWLCGYDPRFEESILIVGKEHTPAILVGNEGWGYCDLAPLPMKKILFQSLSLPGQDRSKSKTLREIFTEEGIGSASAVGIAGWKYFTPEEFSDPGHQFEVPYYIISVLQEIVQDAQRIININDWFMNPRDGFRAINESVQLAAFEFAACHTSNGLKQVLFHIKPGMSEFEAASFMNYQGIPQSAHPMLSAGPRAAYGLPSPSGRKLAIGEPFTMAMGLWGALNARAGWFVQNEDQLPVGVKDYVNKLAIPYFRAVARWYEHIGIGVTGKELYEIIHEEIGDPFFGVSLNPGHLIHIDEWLHSPVFAGSDIPLQSGMAIQVDVIPATGSAYHTINIEDGIALADETLREQIKKEFPEMWHRIEQRRSFMQEVIGIKLKPEVLPFSNIPAYLPPFILSPERVLVKVRH